MKNIFANIVIIILVVSGQLN